MQEAPIVIVILNTNAKSPFLPVDSDERISEICDSLSIGASVEPLYPPLSFSSTHSQIISTVSEKLILFVWSEVYWGVSRKYASGGRGDGIRDIVDRQHLFCISGSGCVSEYRRSVGRSCSINSNIYFMESICWSTLIFSASKGCSASSPLYWWSTKTYNNKGICQWRIPPYRSGIFGKWLQ